MTLNDTIKCLLVEWRIASFSNILRDNDNHETYS